MLFKRNLSILVVATLLLTFISIAIATPVQGKSKRVAVITELKGSATVKSAGGSREYDVYPDMGLNQGDYITTESNSSVKVVIKDRGDEFTIGSNAVVSISILADKGKDKKSKLKLLSGSVWSNVNKLSGGDDYEVETPTAVMAVRGTKVLTNVNSETGGTYVAVAAGTVSARTNNQSSIDNNNNDNNNSNNDSDTKNKEILIVPSQQLSLDSRTEVDDLETKVALIDPEKLVSETSSEIIEAIVKDKQAIDKENAEFIADQKDKIEKGEKTGISRGDADSSLAIKDLSSLDKVTKNLDNLIGNVVNKAIEDKKVDKEQINKVIEEANKNITDPDKKLDLNKVVPLDKTAGVDESLNKAKEEELKKLVEAKKKAEEEKKKAEEAAKLKLAEALKKLEEEKARILKEKEALGLKKPTPTPKPVATTPPPEATTPPPTVTSAPKIETPTFSLAAGTYYSVQSVGIISTTTGATIYYTLDGSTPTSSSKLYSSSSPISVTTTKTIKAIAIKSGSNNSDVATALYTIELPTVIITSPTSFTTGQTFNLALNMINLSFSDQVYGVEMHVVYDNDSSITKTTSAASPPPAPSSYLFDLKDTTSVYRYDFIEGSSNNEFIFAAVIPGMRTLGVVNRENLLVDLPLTFNSSSISNPTVGNGTKAMKIYIKVVNKEGIAIYDNITSNQPDIINFTSYTSNN